MADAVFVQARVREIVKSGGRDDFRISEEFLTALNETVTKVVTEAADRAQKNGRKTLQAQDL